MIIYRKDPTHQKTAEIHGVKTQILPTDNEYLIYIIYININIIYIYIDIYIYIYWYFFIYIYIYIYIEIFFIYIYIYLFIYWYWYIYIYIYLFIDIDIYIYIFIYWYWYIYIRKFHWESSLVDHTSWLFVAHFASFWIVDRTRSDPQRWKIRPWGVSMIACSAHL